MISNFEASNLMTASEVAERLNVSKTYVYALLKSGEIPTIQIGRTVRVLPQDLDAFVQANRQMSRYE